ncbi:MAG: DNA-directed RNA polymerase subunit omega [Candidatus Omnitrophota bacterium]
MQEPTYTPLAKLLDKTDQSTYKLVVLAAKRGQAIAEGSPKLVEAGLEEKPSTVALREIVAGKVRIKKAK